MFLGFWVKLEWAFPRPGFKEVKKFNFFFLLIIFFSLSMLCTQCGPRACDPEMRVTRSWGSPCQAPRSGWLFDVGLHIWCPGLYSPVRSVKSSEAVSSLANPKKEVSSSWCGLCQLPCWARSACYHTSSGPLCSIKYLSTFDCKIQLTCLEHVINSYLNGMLVPDKHVYFDIMYFMR